MLTSGQTASLPQALLLVLLAILALLGNHILLATFGVVGFVWLVGFLIATFFVAPSVAIVTLVVGLLFQNTLLAFMAGHVEAPDIFQTIQGTSFLITLVLGSLSLAMLARHAAMFQPADQRVVRVGVIFLAVTVFYLLLGMLQVSPGSALAYARLYFNGPLLLAAGLWLCWQTPPAVLRDLFLIAAGFLVVWGVWELVDAYSLYSAFNVDQFLALKYANRPEAAAYDSIKEAIELNTRSYLNLSGSFGLDLQMLRLKGPSMHAITYGYTLAFFALVLFMLRRPFLATSCVVVALLVGAKGPLLMLLVSLLLYAGYALARYNMRLLGLGLLMFALVYIVGGLAYGLYTDDYHVIGFIGGIKGFMSNPIGHGIGVGGNMSDLSFDSRDFAAFQKFGADYALESALGVMLYQLGVATLVFIWLYRVVWNRMWSHAKQYSDSTPRLFIIPLAMGILAVNTIFQEEALSPAGWGLWLLLAGIVLGWSRQNTASSA